MLTVQVPFGAAVMLMFFWRRLTAAAVWAAVIVSSLLNIVGPKVAESVDAWRTHQGLVVQVEEGGVKTAVFWDAVVHQKPDDLASPLEGRGRLHLELVVLDKLGLDLTRLDVSTRYAVRFFFDGLFPFVVLLLVSRFPRHPPAAIVDLFYGKMKTPVDPVPERDAAAMAETQRNPRRFDDRKLFPRSAWEFTKWDRVDMIGFLACCGLSGAIFGGFYLILQAAK
jgi:hypothetical protein